MREISYIWTSFPLQLRSDLHQVLFGKCRCWLVWKMYLRNSHNHSIIAQGNISVPTLMYPKYMQMFACSFSETTGELGVGWGPGNFSGLEYFWKKDSKFNFESTAAQEKRLTALRDHARGFIPCSSLKLPVLMMEGVDEQPDSRLVPSHCLRMHELFWQMPWARRGKPQQYTYRGNIVFLFEWI